MFIMIPLIIFIILLFVPLIIYLIGRKHGVTIIHILLIYILIIASILILIEINNNSNNSLNSYSTNNNEATLTTSTASDGSTIYNGYAQDSTGKVEYKNYCIHPDGTTTGTMEVKT